MAAVADYARESEKLRSRRAGLDEIRYAQGFCDAWEMAIKMLTRDYFDAKRAELDSMG
jgi:hypothetical protein